MFDPLLSPTALPIDEETLAGAEEQEADETLLPVTQEEIPFYEDDKTLSEMLNSLHSTKVRRMHKYTDDQLALMHKHSEYNRMLEAYIDVSIHNGHVSGTVSMSLLFHFDQSLQLTRARRLLDDLLLDQERRQSMKHLSWRYVSSINVYNAFFFAYADKVALQIIGSVLDNSLLLLRGISWPCKSCSRKCANTKSNQTCNPMLRS